MNQNLVGDSRMRPGRRDVDAPAVRLPEGPCGQRAKLKLASLNVTMSDFPVSMKLHFKVHVPKLIYITEENELTHCKPGAR